jgi:uncharacterized membrane protein
VRKWAPILLIVAATVASLVVYPNMPERVPTHWDITGKVDGWSSRFFGAWLMPLMMAVILVILRVVPLIDPRRANYEKFAGAYEWIVTLTILFMFGLHVMLLLVATGTNVPVGRVMPAAVGAFFIALGVLLPKAHPNWFVGIRTPWTLTSDVSWEKTHRLGGILFSACGVATILTTLVAPDRALWVLMAGGIATAVSLLAYSYVVWKRDRNGLPGATVK